MVAMSFSYGKRGWRYAASRRAELRTALGAGCWRKRVISLAPIEMRRQLMMALGEMVI
jgi:hypothetical protein